VRKRQLWIINVLYSIIILGFKAILIHFVLYNFIKVEEISYVDAGPENGGLKSLETQGITCNTTRTYN
jgi:hypothetical protein